VEDGQAPNSVVEDAIESFGALVCAAGAGQTGHGDGGTMDISVAFTPSGSFAETDAGLRRYVEQVYDLSLCPVRLRDALAYAVVGWRQKHRADAAVCSECPFVPKSD
jgi:hypothetical protein